MITETQFIEFLTNNGLKDIHNKEEFKYSAINELFIKYVSFPVKMVEGYEYIIHNPTEFFEKLKNLKKLLLQIMNIKEDKAIEHLCKIVRYMIQENTTARERLIKEIEQRLKM